MQYAITTQQLEKRYNGKEVIHASNMSVEYGTIYGLLGRNGAGGIFTVILVIVVLLHCNLCYRVKKMEV